MTEIDFLRPKLDGQRFEEHAIPLDFLKDLSVLEEFVISVAKAQWLKDNPGRRRTPPGFMSGVSIKLAQVDEGSAISPEHRDTILDAQKDALDGVRVAVRGIGRFNRSNKLVKFEEVEDVAALDPLDVAARIDELRLLRTGWLNGGGKALDPAGSTD